MAFITAEQTKEIKRELSQKYPNLKFSVKNRNYTAVDVAIVGGDIDFSDLLNGRNHTSVNQYALMREYGEPVYGEHTELLRGIFKIVNEGNYDRSDMMTDYFDVGFYVDFEIGRWDKPYVCTAKAVV